MWLYGCSAVAVFAMLCFHGSMSHSVRPQPQPSPWPVPKCPVVHCPTIQCPEVKCPQITCPETCPKEDKVTFNCNCNKEAMKKDNCEWKLIFKAVKGNNRNVFQDFTDDVPINENNAEAMIINSNKLPFKSPLINEWNKMLIKEVKVEVFREGERKAWFLFDGLASTRTSWFSQSKLIASPYTNLKTESLNHFSIAGVPEENVRFFINKDDPTCTGDCGYLVAVDSGASRCPWMRIEQQPYFLYDPNPDKCCKWKDATNCADLVADVMFVIDVSGSIDTTEFNQLISFVKSIVSSLPIGLDKTRIGAISFASTANLEFAMNVHDTEEDVLAALDKIANRQSGTATSAALNLLKSEAFTTANGDRDNADDLVFVLTDGKSNNKQATLDAVKGIENEGYTRFAVGIGNSLDLDELNAISSDPDSTFTLLANFDSLDTILNTIIGSACRVLAPVRAAGTDPPSADKIADVLAVSVKTCDLEW